MKARLHETAEFTYQHSKGEKVSLALFKKRFYALEERGLLTEISVNDALLMPSKEYKKIYSPRKTIVNFEEKPVDLKSLYDTYEKPICSYQTFRSRVKSYINSGSCNYEICYLAAHLNKKDWVCKLGRGNCKSFIYEGDVYEEYKGQYFPSLKAFLNLAGLSEHYGTVKSRIQNGWPIFIAIDTPIYTREYEFGVGYIYMLENPINNHFYIGKTVQNPESRHFQHIMQSKKDSRKISREIKKFGSECFNLIILERVYDLSKLEEREEYWIKQKGATSGKGLNLLAKGGPGRVLGTEIEYMGHVYPSVSAASRLLSEKLGVPEYIVENNISKGQPIPKNPRKISSHKEAGKREWRRWKSLINGVKAGRRKGVISPEWLNYDNWARDVIPSYVKGASLTRINDELPWGKENFKWVSRRDVNNKIHGKSLLFNGKEYPSWQALSEDVSVPVSTLKYRVRKRGLTLEQACIGMD